MISAPAISRYREGKPAVAFTPPCGFGSALDASDVKFLHSYG